MPYEDLANEINEALTPVGYGWAGGIVLTDLDDPAARRVMALNPHNGTIVPQLGAWVSWCTPLGGLDLPTDVKIAPGSGKKPSDWAAFHAYAMADGMLVVACDDDGAVLYVAATERSREHAPLLALAALRTIEDTDILPRALEDAATNPPSNWGSGWSINRAAVLK